MGAIMNQDDFLKTRSGEIIIIGNGVGLLNIPMGFLLTRPTFALNHFTMWVPWLKPDYWLSTDEVPAQDMIHALPGVPKFVAEWTHDILVAEGHDHPELVRFKFLQRVDGIPYVGGTLPGTRYATSLLAASHLAVEMGFTRILWVGFDCTQPTMINPDAPKGISGTPHFYDPLKPSRPSETWNKQAGAFARWAESIGVEVVNLSYPTRCDTVRQLELSSFWHQMTEPEFQALYFGRWEDA